MYYIKSAYRSDSGFSLIELLATIVISMILALAAIPMLQQRIKQSGVDAYTNRLESGLRQLSQRMVNNQNGCTIVFPIGSNSEVELLPRALESLKIKTSAEPESSPGFANTCQPSSQSLVENMTMDYTSLRFVNIKNTLNQGQANDIRLLIYPDCIVLNTLGGSTKTEDCPGSNYSGLTIRIRSSSLHSQGKGFERCLIQPFGTSNLTRGTWVGTGSQGECISKR